MTLVTSLTRLVARGRKRNLSSCATSQADCMASTSASVAERTADANEQRPRKRHKRSSSTPAAPRPSQLSAQLQSRRRTRSRAGSPTTDVENIPRSRVSARLLRKIHPFLDGRSSDIYMHLADPDGKGNLLSEPPAGSVVLSTPNEMVGSQSVKRSRGRRRNTVDLTNENTKRDLMEEWARMRQSQGALSLSGINGNTCFSQMLLHDNRKGDGSDSPIHLETITRRNSLDPDLVGSQTTIVSISQSQETTLDVSPKGSSSIRMDFENALPVGTDASGKNLDLKDLVLPSDGGTEQTILDSHVDEDSLGELQYPESTLPSLPASPSREDAVHTRHAELTKFPVNEQAEPESLDNPPKESHPVSFLQTFPFGTGSIHLDSDEEFYMLDIPEVFTLPWVPVSSHLYVPPGLGKLISGK